MQTNNNQTAAGQYNITPATAKLLDCLRAGQNYYDMIAEAMQQRYAGTLSPDEAEAKAKPYLDIIGEIADMLHDEINSSIIDALSDTRNATAAVIQI